jgi:hypothetical protein
VTYLFHRLVPHSATTSSNTLLGTGISVSTDSLSEGFRKIDFKVKTSIVWLSLVADTNAVSKEIKIVSPDPIGHGVFSVVCASARVCIG